MWVFEWVFGWFGSSTGSAQAGMHFLADSDQLDFIDQTEDIDLMVH